MIYAKKSRGRGYFQIPSNKERGVAIYCYPDGSIYYNLELIAKIKDL